MLPIKNYSVLRCWSGAILLLWAFIKKNKKKAIYEESVGSSEYTHTRTHVLVNLKTLLLHFGYTGNKSFQKVSRKSKRKDCSKTECWTWQPSVRSVMFASFLNVKPAFLHAHTDRQGSTVYHKAARHQMKMPAVVQTVGSAMLELWRSCDMWSYVVCLQKSTVPPPHSHCNLETICSGSSTLESGFQFQCLRMFEKQNGSFQMCLPYRGVVQRAHWVQRDSNPDVD